MYLRLTISGGIGAVEQWSVNPCFFIDNDSDFWSQSSAEAIVQAMVTGVTLPAGLKNVMGASVTVRSYRLEGRSDNGALLGVAEAAIPLPIAGTGTSTKSPQAALVLSLRTSVPGPSGRGRLYWPALAVGLDSNFRVNPTITTAAATGAATYLEALSAAIRDNAGLFPWTQVLLAVVSPTRALKTPVTRIQVGDVLDTQRRRRDALPEVYVVAPYPPTA